MLLINNYLQTYLAQSSLAPLLRSVEPVASSLFPLMVLLEASTSPSCMSIGKAAVGAFLALSTMSWKKEGEKETFTAQLIHQCTKVARLALLVDAAAQGYRELSWKPLAPFALYIPLAVTRLTKAPPPVPHKKVDCPPLEQMDINTLQSAFPHRQVVEKLKRQLQETHYLHFYACKKLKECMSAIVHTDRNNQSGKMFVLNGSSLQKNDTYTNRRYKQAVAHAKNSGGSILFIKVEDSDLAASLKCWNYITPPLIRVVAIDNTATTKHRCFCDISPTPPPAQQITWGRPALSRQLQNTASELKQGKNYAFYLVDYPSINLCIQKVLNIIGNPPLDKVTIVYGGSTLSESKGNSAALRAQQQGMKALFIILPVFKLDNLLWEPSPPLNNIKVFIIHSLSADTQETYYFV